MLLSVSINIYLYNMILSEETSRYPEVYHCRSPLVHTGTIYTCRIWYCQKKHQDMQQYNIAILHYYIPVQYGIIRRNTKISISMLLPFSINTYRYNMILTEVSLRYPAAYYFPFQLIYISTILYCQQKH
jgi:hypothetical protein